LLLMSDKGVKIRPSAPHTSIHTHLYIYVCVYLVDGMIVERGDSGEQGEAHGVGVGIGLLSGGGHGVAERKGA